MGFDIATFIEMFPALLWMAFVSFSLGYALTREKSLMTMGFGLAAFCVLSIILDLVGIPLSWLTYVVISAAILAYFAYKKELSLDMKLEMPDRTVQLVLLMAAVNFLVFWAGANAYPYLEDDDPWTHATGTTLVTMTQSASRFFDGVHFTRLYLEPYPPSYDILMGVMHQLTTSVSETLKFFNAYLIGGSLIFAFFAISELTKDRRIGLLSVFFLLCLPSFMSHFIWAQTLAVLMMFVAFYGFERSLSDKRFVLPSATAAATVALSQPSTAAIFALLFVLYALARLYSHGTTIVKPFVTAVALALLFSALFYIPVYLKYGLEYTLSGLGIVDTIFAGGSGEDTSGGLVYGPMDFLVVQNTGKIDQHIGIGIVISLLSIAGLGFIIMEKKSWKEKGWMAIALLWLVFAFLGVEGNALPVKLFPHRFWVFLSVPVAMTAAYGYIRLEERTVYKKAALAAIIIAVLLTSADGKLQVQTAQWPPGMDFSSPEELGGYIYLKDALPKNTLVFPLCSNDNKLIGSDMLSEPYVPEYEAFKRDALDKSPEEVYQFLKSRGYSYMTIDSTCFRTLGQENALALVSSYEQLGAFQPVFSNGGFAILKVS